MNAALEVSAPALRDFCESNGIRRLSVFGSALRADFRPGSDIDLLVEFEPGTRIGLIGLAALELELGERLGRKVDLNTPGCLSPHFRDRVLASAETIYERA